jgi:hypothetical protein
MELNSINVYLYKNGIAHSVDARVAPRPRFKLTLMQIQAIPNFKKAKSLVKQILQGFCGPDGTRTRDPMRDRHVF